MMIFTKIRKGIFTVFLSGVAKISTHRFVALLTFCFFAFTGFSQTVITYDASGTFTVPAGVTSITVQCWGGGGAGGRGYTVNGASGGGGGGGAYASSTIAVTFGQSYNVVVGAGGTSPTNNNGNPGGASSFGTNLVLAAGGSGGNQAITNTAAAGGAGGTVAASIGTIRFAGGNGVAGINGTGAGACGGGGGAAAGSGGAGSNGNQCAGGTGVAPSGNGGSGSRNAVGGAGSSVAGGGAGGNRNNTNNIGGAGAAGRIVVTYTVTGGSPVTYFSKATGNWNAAGTWTTSPTHTGANAGPPVAGDAVVIGNGHTVNTNNGNRACLDLAIIGSGVLDFTNNNNTVTVSGNFSMDGTSQITGNNAARVLNVGGNFNVPETATNASISGQTITITGTTNIAGTLTLNNNTGVKTFTGSVTNSGSWTSTAITTVGNLVFNGSTDQTLSGTGTFAFGSIQLNKSGTNLLVNQSISVNTNISWASDGLFVVDGDANITLAAAATITAPDNNRYIQLDGTSSNGSQLIKTSNGNVSSWSIVFPVGTASGGYSPVDFLTNNAVTAPNPTNGSTLAIKSMYNPSVLGQMRRTFRITVTGNNASTTLSNGRFHYNTTSDISTGDVQANYNAVWFLGSGAGNWTTIPGTAPGTLVSGDRYYFTASSTPQSLGNNPGTTISYYSIGASAAYPNVWYSYQTGVWSNWENWTLDPSGTTLVNPMVQLPGLGDEVVIVNGFTITTDINNIVLGSVTIQAGGILDMDNSTGHTFGTVSGAGLLRIRGVSLPTGNYAAFVAAGTGTVEYYNTDGTLSTTQASYNNLLLTNDTNSPVTFVTASNLTVNGNLNITQTGGSGTVTWQINDASNTQRTINLTGDVTVSAGGRIRAGTGNPANPHNLVLTGNLTNNGSIKFFDDTFATLSEANYASGAIYTAAATGRAVNVTFTGVTNQAVMCNSETDFYRLIVNKGTGQQAMLTVNSSGASNFRLFGRNNQDLSGAAPNYISNNNLSIINGTLQLTGTITIPSLVVSGGGGIGGGWPIPQSGALWINSPDVSIQATSTTVIDDDGRQIYVFGLLRMSSGTLTSGYSRGILGGGSGSIIVEGGTINTPQLRTTYLGSDNRFAYNQSGGTVNIGTVGLTGPTINTYPRFALPYAECTFSMSNGTINVANPTTAGTSIHGGILIFASPSNIQVTGGTVNAILPASATNFTITSTAPFYNLNISKTGAAGASAVILNPMSFNDNTQIDRAAQPLTILGDLTIITGGNNPTLNCNGNNLTVSGNLTIQPGTTLTSGTNTITFNGTGTQTWTSSGTINTLANATVVVNKASGALTLAGGNAIPTTGNIGNLILTAGTLNDGGKTLDVTSSLSNSAVHTGSGLINLNGPTTISGNDGTFGTLRIQTNNTVTVAGNQTVTGTLRLVSANSSLNIGSNSLAALGDIYSNDGTDVAFGNSKRILTSGLHNAGGLTRQAVSGQDLLFPVGTGAIYTPATINVTATTAGQITVRPVASLHPNRSSGDLVAYYWRVSQTGFANISSVVHKSYTYANATKAGILNQYRPARYDEAVFEWAYRNTTYNANNAPGTTTIPDFNTGTNWTGLGIDRLEGDYTAGMQAAFVSPTVYYSRQNGNWGTNNTWSNVAIDGAAAGSPPCATCPVVIGDGAANNHTVAINGNNQGGGSLFLASGSTLDCGTAFTGLNFGVNTSGTGILRVGSVNFPAGDFLSFLGPAGGTVEWYGAGKTIPATGPAPMNLSLATYYNLVVSPDNAATITLPASNLTIYNDFTSGGTGTGIVATNVAAARTITVNKDINVTSATLQLSSSTAATSTSFIVEGNTTISLGASMVVQDAGTGNHVLTTNGSLVNNGTLNLRRSGTRYADLVFTGTTNTSLTGTNGGATTTLNQITIDKGTSQTPMLTFDVAGTLNTLTNNWLTLSNGQFVYNRNSTVTLTNTANNPYTIPSTSRLTVQAGIVNISNINNNNSDLLLAGALEVTGGTVNVGNSANNNNNDIEYAAAGVPAIVVSGGSLYVNGAIRRSTATLSGALSYTQTGGTVTVAGRAAANTRGIFEIENYPGSSFTLTGTSELQVLRSSGGAAFPDLYLNPLTSNVAATSIIQLGANALGAQTLTMNAVPSLGSFQVMGAGGNAQTVNMQSSELTTSGTLTINTASTLNTNALNVTVGGNLSIIGTYNGSNNTTIFNGVGAQAAALSASSQFQNITVNKSTGTVTLSGTSPTITNLNLLNGVLNVGTLGLTVQGDIVNNSSQIGTGAIVMSGNSVLQNIASSGGSFTNLTLSGSAGTKNVVVEGALSIVGTLDFATTNRFLTIGSYPLTFGASATVTGAGGTAFIRTNGVSSDLGVVKIWPVAGASPFTYAVGTQNNYTPVTVTLTVSTSGSLSIVPVNSRHPTANIGSPERILNYYWILSRDNSLAYSATGSHVYAFPAALMGGAGATFAAGYLDLSDPVGWITSGHNGSATTTSMAFTNLLNTNLPQQNSSYHLTVGTENTLPNPIIPVYSRLANADVNNPAIGGNWSDPNSWTLQADGMGAPLGSAPFGAPVVILNGARVNVNVNARNNFSTIIDGLVVINTTFGHGFGNISGTGALRFGTNTFPAGNYAAFVSSSGGTIEYIGPMTMNNRNTYNNLSIIGTGNVTMTATNLTLNGNVSIASGATLNNSANNANMTIAGNWSNSGSFNPGTATVTFNGSGPQSVTGSTTFNNIAITKAGSNLTLTGAGTTTVNGILTLTNGHLIVPPAHLLTLPLSGSISGGSASSYISGAVRKSIPASGSVTFPIGKIAPGRYRPASITGTTGIDTWTVEYVGNDPTADGFPNATINLSNPPPNDIKSVSMFEYWLVSRVGSAAAGLSLSYNTGSYTPPNIGNVPNLRIARWDGAQWDVPSGGGSSSQSGDNITGTVSITNVTSFSPFTLASLDAISPLPVELDKFWAEVVPGGVDLFWETASELNNHYFTVERSVTGETFTAIGDKVAGKGTTNQRSKYSLKDTNPVHGTSYYRLKQTDFDGSFAHSKTIAVKYDGPSMAFMNVYPNPVFGNEVTIEINGLKGVEEIPVIIFDQLGKEIYRAVLEVDGNGFVAHKLVFENPVADGVYIVKAGATLFLIKRLIILNRAGN